MSMLASYSCVLLLVVRKGEKEEEKRRMRESARGEENNEREERVRERRKEGEKINIQVRKRVSARECREKLMRMQKIYCL